jgi:spore maturation protein CgeB
VLDRGPWIERLVAEFGLRVLSFHGAAGPDASAIGKGMVRAVNSFRLHWNRNLADDINYRTFETLGCGTLLLTNYTPGLEKLFDPGRHLALYQDWDDLRRTVRRLLDDPEERAEIAAAGHAHARAHHTYDVRARQLLDLVRRM